ncbi:hypothetical protein KCU73_g14303, partial [Aureobasidium melanogenum]
EADTGVVAFEVAVLDKVLDGFDDLLEKVGLFETCLKHCADIGRGLKWCMDRQTGDLLK